MCFTKISTFKKIKKVLRKYRNRRWYSINDIDTLIVSFPKSGRTWLRIMLSNIFENHYKIKIQNRLKLDLYSRENSDIPLLSFQHQDRPHLKTPEDLNDDVSLHANKKVIFLARNPRDVVVSFYFELTKRKGKHKGSISEFLNENVGSLKTIIKYYNIWAKRMRINNIHLVKYENLHTDLYAELTSILNYIGITNVPKNLILSAIEFAKFDNMKKLEKMDYYSYKSMRAANPADPESYKVRRGVMGGYVDYLSDDDITYLNNEINEHLDKIYGYDN